MVAIDLVRFMGLPLPLLLVLGLLFQGCSSARADSSDAGMIVPLLAQLFSFSASGRPNGNVRTKSQVLADLDAIPVSVVERVDGLRNIQADTTDGVLEVIGLARFRARLFIVSIGDPLTPEMYIYYSRTRYIHYLYDAVRQKIAGPINKGGIDN